MIVGTDTASSSSSTEESRDAKSTFFITGGADKKIRFWDMSHVENSLVISGLEAEETKPVYVTEHLSGGLAVNIEKSVRPAPGTRTFSKESTKKEMGNGGSAAAARPPRSTVISLQQQQLLRSHLDSVLDVKMLEVPYGMVVSVDRSGVVFVFQ